MTDLQTVNPEIASTIDVAGVATNYHDVGEGDPVLLIHGSGPGVSAWANWRGVFGDQALAAAMIDRVVHHADVLTLKGASYRLRNRGIDTLPSIKTQDTAN